MIAMLRASDLTWIALQDDMNTTIDTIKTLAYIPGGSSSSSHDLGHLALVDKETHDLVILKVKTRMSLKSGGMIFET